MPPGSMRQVVDDDVDPHSDGGLVAVLGEVDARPSAVQVAGRRVGHDPPRALLEYLGTLPCFGLPCVSLGMAGMAIPAGDRKLSPPPRDIVHAILASPGTGGKGQARSTDSQIPCFPAGPCSVN